MIGPLRKKNSAACGMRRLALACAAAALAAFAAACGTDYFEIPIQRPIQPKLGVSPALVGSNSKASLSNRFLDLRQ